jgi:hypothetical protein
MRDFDSLKATLTNVSQIARGGQKVVYSATHPTYGNIVLKLFFKMDARSQREIEISENSDFGCVPTIYETEHVIYEGADTLCIFQQRVDGEELRKRIERGDYWDIDGVYIVCEHPERHYLVDRPIWIANLLSLVAGIKRLGKEVIVGYANHQMLPLALAKCDAIAAGNFLNVRWFQPEHFETTDKDEQSRRTTWYYCPQALSEFKVTYLDVAKRAGILATMATPAPMENKYSRILFGGATPSLTNYKEGDSFKHYLHCLRIQCELASKSTYDETRNAQFAQLETAARILNGLHNERIKGQDRDFGEIADVNEAAIQIFDKEFGFAMAQEW